MKSKVSFDRKNLNIEYCFSLFFLKQDWPQQVTVFKMFSMEWIWNIFTDIKSPTIIFLIKHRFANKSTITHQYLFT